MPYSHILIPTQPAFAPTPEQVAGFFIALQTTGAVPDPPELCVAVPTGKFRSVPNPFTGGTVQIAEKKWTDISRAEELSAALKGLATYQVISQGDNVPRVPPLEVLDPSGKDLTRTCQLQMQAMLRPEPATDFLSKGTSASRFAVLFMWGKFAVPRKLDGSAHVAATVIHAAETSFGLTFAQDGEYTDD